MCGIFASFGILSDVQRLKAAAKLQKHRGPDSYDDVVGAYHMIAHNRLAINGVDNGSQPFVRGNRILVVNGEIYNHMGLRSELCATLSDCECVFDVEQFNQLDGVYGLVIYDTETKEFTAARDPFGVMPLYIGINTTNVMFSSEIKSLEFMKCDTIAEVPPGCTVKGIDGKLTGMYSNELISPTTYGTITDIDVAVKMVRDTMYDAVVKRMMSDVPYAVLLSGGLDSTICAAVAQQVVKSKDPNATITTFSVGYAGSSDIVAATAAAEFLKTKHHNIIIDSIDPMLIKDVIKYVETFDVATVRSAIPMIILARAVRSHGFKMVLNGDGSDEVFAGYDYFQYAPDAISLHEESVRKVSTLGRFDCRRANHSMMAASIECRCPFLDTAVVDVAFNKISPELKMFKKIPGSRKFGEIEKYILRKAFEDILPESVCWRGKVQFSAGCGDKLIGGLIQYANDEISNDEFSLAKLRFPIMTPMSREALLYRKIYHTFYKSTGTITYEKSLWCSTVEAYSWFPADVKKLVAVGGWTPTD